MVPKSPFLSPSLRDYARLLPADAGGPRTSVRKVVSCDAGDATGCDVLDTAEHAAWRLCARVHLEDERTLGREQEREGTRGLVRPRSVAIAFSCHAADDTARRRCVRQNGCQITVSRG